MLVRRPKGRSVLKDILKSAGGDTLKYFPVRLVPALTSLVTVPVFTRLITREDYGDFFLVNSAVSLTGMLFTSWLSASIVRFYWSEERQGRLDRYVSTVVWASMISLAIGAALLAAAMVLLGGVFGDGMRRLMPIALASLLLGQFIQLMQQLMRAANRARTFATLSIASALLSAAFSVFFVAVPRWGAFGILAGVAAGNVLLLPLALRNARSEGSLSPRHVSTETVREFAAYGVPMIPAAVSSWVLILSDRYIIGLSQTAADVGLYGAAYGLGDKIMGLVTAPLLIAIGPVMVQTFEKKGQLLAQQVQTQLTRYYAMATVPLVFGLWVIARPFMDVFTGPDYRSAFPILPIVAAGVMAYGASQIANNGLAMHKKSLTMMQNTLLAAVLQVTLNLLLVPRFGYIAAAWNTLFAYAALLGLAWLRSRPYMAWRLPWSDLVRIAGASGFMAAVLVVAFRWFDSSVWLLLAEVATGIVVYAFALWASRGLRPDELEYLGDMRRAIARRIRRA